MKTENNPKKTKPAPGKSKAMSTTETVVKKGPGRPKKTELPTNFIRVRILTQNELNAKGIGDYGQPRSWSPYMNYLCGKLLFVENMQKDGSFTIKNKNPKATYPHRDWTIYPEFYIKEDEPGYELPTTVTEETTSSTTITIEVPEGCVIDTENSTATKLVFKKVSVQKEKPKALPKTWEEVKYFDGFYVSAIGQTVSLEKIKAANTNRNTFKTKEQAEASIALAQLSILREIYRQGWVPDWSKDEGPNIKWCIHYIEGKPEIDSWRTREFFLSFESKAIAEQFLENFCDLIEQARPLMS
jgi:acyl-CoA hydrolase